MVAFAEKFRYSAYIVLLPAPVALNRPLSDIVPAFPSEDQSTRDAFGIIVLLRESNASRENCCVLPTGMYAPWGETSMRASGPARTVTVEMQEKLYSVLLARTYPVPVSGNGVKMMYEVMFMCILIKPISL